MLQQLDTAIGFAVVMLMLSLNMTAIVQIISALTDLRGRNLTSGLQNLLRLIEPEFRKPLPDGSKIADHIAEAVVRHPAIAHAGTRAKAVSQSELPLILVNLCSDGPAATLDTDAQKKLQGLLEARVPGGTDAGAAAQTASRLAHQVGEWFDTVMDRLSDIFTRTMRVITVAISAMLVVALHIDSGEILRQITHSPELRAKLVAVSDRALSHADEMFDNEERASVALAEVKKRHSSKPEDEQIVVALDKMPAHLTRCVDGRNSLVENTKTLANAGTLLTEFDNACQGKTQQAMGDAYAEIGGLRTDLEKSDLKIIPTEIGGPAYLIALGSGGLHTAICATSPARSLVFCS
jgi:hypothetical protein